MQNIATNHDADPPSVTNRLTEASHDQSASHGLAETRQLGKRHTVKEAAEVLGTTVDAIRGRVRRGTLDSVKLDGVVYVLLDPTNREQQSDQSETDDGDHRQQTGDQAELVGALRDQIDWLRREVERKDTIIMSLTRRIPELEAPTVLQDGPETAAPLSDKGTAPENSEELVQRRSWLYRFFFGPS